jgi:hypothetical protein
VTEEATWPGIRGWPVSYLQEFIILHLNMKNIHKKSLTFRRDLRLNIKVMSLKPDPGLMK